MKKRLSKVSGGLEMNLGKDSLINSPRTELIDKSIDSSIRQSTNITDITRTSINVKVKLF